MDEARRQASLEWKGIQARREELDQGDRPWNTDGVGQIWIELRIIGLTGKPPESLVMSYTLMEDEVAEVAAHTERIVKYNTAHRYKDNWAIGDESDYEIKFRGFAAEKAMSELTGLPWRKVMFGTGFKERKACDIGQRVEVRNVRRRDGNLAFKRKDAIDNVYLLTHGKPPGPIRALGWLEGRELVTFPYLEPPRVPFAAHFAPQSELHPLPLPEDA
jgi:hypothetical protein